MKEEKFLLDLIKIKSESGKEKEIGNFIIKRLKDNFLIRKQKVKDSFNILAFKGKPKILLAVHLDTVSGKIKIKKEKKYIYGRGACDTKSQIAAMVLAAEKAELSLNNFGLLFTIQEETDFLGAKEVVKIIPRSVKLMVVGEPTNLYLVKGQKGIVCFKIKQKGKSAHGSMPEKGINAIELLIKDLENIKKIKFSKNELGENAINIGLIKGGKAENIVPDYAEAVVTIRNVIGAKEIIKILRKKIKGEIEIIFSYDPILNKEAEKIAKKLKLKVKTVPYFTEAAFFNKKAKTLVLGAGKEEDAHSDREKVRIKDFKKLIEIYYQLLKEYNK